jgi:hypothetical protein
MITTTLKKKIHEYIDVTDEKILKAVYTILDAHVKSSELDFEFNAEQVKELNKRRKAHLEGKSKSHTFEEIKKQAISKFKK